MARKKTTTADLTEQSVALAEFAAKTLVAAEQLRINTRPVEQFPLGEDERAAVADLAAINPTLKKKLAKKNATFTVADTASVVMAVAESLHESEPLKRFNLLLVAKKLIDCLESNVVSTGIAEARKPKPTGTVFQFKITLLGVKPPIWRRIQVPDCTLDKLHEHIQTSMGWTNSHPTSSRLKASDTAILNCWTTGSRTSSAWTPRRRCSATSFPRRGNASPSSTSMTSATAGSMRSCSRVALPPIRGPSTRSVWKVSVLSTGGLRRGVGL